MTHSHVKPRSSLRVPSIAVAGGSTPAIALLRRHGVAHTVHAYDVAADAPHYGERVAAALGVPAEQVFKSLVTEVDRRLAVAVVPVSRELDLKAAASAFAAKRASMADRALAERTTGYVRGGISPLGQRRQLPTLVDSSAQEFRLIYVSAGRRGLQVALAPADLMRLTQAKTARLTAE